MTDVEIRLSGTIEVRRAGQPVALPGRRMRALLVMLALSAGRIVAVDTLARGLWGDDPPERVRGSLQTYIARLRRVVGAERVATEEAGYRLDVPADAVDLLQFERLVTVSTDAADDRTEADQLDAALALWGGEPFGDPPSEWIERHLVSELTERYLHAIERRIDLDLRGGDASTRLPQLRQLIERNPLRETLWVRLLTALDAGGRTAEALEQYEAIRTRLAHELGVDPSPDLRRVHQNLLTKKAPWADDEAVKHSTTTAPHQLPPAVAGFTGRSEQLASLDSAVDNDAPLIALHGPGGVGKTALAVHWARQRTGQFPDGVLFVDLRGYGPGEPVDALRALDALLRGLGVPGEQIPADTEARSAMLRTALSNRQALVLLDNAREAAQVRPLLTGGSTTTVVTSRSQLRGLVSRDGARRIAVGPLPSDDAVALLADRFGMIPDGALEELGELAELCGHLPVALTVAAERAGRDVGTRVADINERLRDERARLGALTDWADDPLTDVRAIFSWSYQTLDHDTARMFRLLGRHPYPRIATDAAAALAGVDDRTSERLLDRLTDRHLLTETSYGWHELHDLAHTYATELAATQPEETAHAMQRLRSWYLHSASNANEIQAPPVLTYDIPDPLPRISPATFRSSDHATDWLGDHYAVIRSLQLDAADDGDHGTVARIAPMLFLFFKFTGASREAAELFTLAERCAGRTGDRALEAKCALQLGYFLENLGENDASYARYEAARRLYVEIDDLTGRLSADIAIGTGYAQNERFDEAIETLSSALDGPEGADYRVLATIYNNLATIYLMVGRVKEANDTAGRAVETAAGAARPDDDHLAYCHLTLGEAQSAAAEWSAVVDTLGEASRLFDASGNVVGAILALQARGVAHRERGDAVAARADWTTALDRLDELGLDELPSHGIPDTGQRDELHRLLGDLDDQNQ